MFLLHLSDFHFGPKSRFAEIDPAELGRRLGEDLREALAKIRPAAGIDVVVVTGDLAESGNLEQFSEARAFLETLAADLNLPRLSFVILPGNHDVSWELCQMVELEQRYRGYLDDERDRRIHERKLAGFDSLLKEFYTDLPLEQWTRPLAAGGRVFHFDPLRLSVAALNSCEKETHRPADRVGLVSKGQAQSLLDLWRDPSLDGYFKVIALHHPPVSVTKANADAWTKFAREKGVSAELVDRFVADLRGIEGSEDLKILAKNTGAQLVLHGHQHAGDTNHWADGRCHVLSAGSLCLVSGELPADEPLSFRLIELEHFFDEAQAGAGKSTWVKYTFRRLVREEGAFPLLLVLRDLALTWKPEVKGEERSLLAYLENKLGERLAGQLPKDGLKLQPLLAAEQGPRPILLVDGWDEIGAIGEEVRAKLLALMNLHPRLLVIVTSRPCDAGGRSSHTEGFEELDVQPLNDEEIRRFSARYFDHLHGADLARSGEEVAGFERALERSLEARELARTESRATGRATGRALSAAPEPERYWPAPNPFRTIRVGGVGG